MSKYQRLTEFLANRDESDWNASFQEIEEVLGVPLPDSASQHPAWWANQGRGQSLAWESAGWKIKGVDLRNQRVRFLYIAGNQPEEAQQAKLTIAEAKAGLAATFNVPVEAVEITIRG